MQKKRICVLVIAVMLLVGAVHASGVLNYFRDRAYDFLDIFELRICAARHGAGFGLHARATALAQVGWIYFDGEKFGMDRRGIGLWRERKMEGGISLLHFSDVLDDVAYGNQFTDKDSAWSRAQYRGIVRNDVFWDDGRDHPLSIGAEVQLLILPGVEIAVYPTEAVDFVVGFLTLDPWEDDLSRIEHRRIIPAEEEAKEGEEEERVLEENYQETLKNLDKIPFEKNTEPVKEGAVKQEK
jgi:hypothetical protein